MLFDSIRSLSSSITRSSSSNESGWVDVYSYSSERAANTAQPTILPYKASANGLSIGVPLLSGARSLDVVINSHRSALNIAELSKTMCFEGGLQGSYAYQDIAAYSESSNFTWAARKLTQSAGGISAGVVYQSSDAHSYSFPFGAQRPIIAQGRKTLTLPIVQPIIWMRDLRQRPTTIRMSG